MFGLAPIGAAAIGGLLPGVTAAVDLPAYDALEAASVQLVFVLEIEVGMFEAAATISADNLLLADTSDPLIADSDEYLIH